MVHTSTTATSSASAKEQLALLIFVGCAVGHFLGAMWSLVVPFVFYRRERCLQQEIAEAEKESHLYHTPQQMHLYGKTQRRIIALRQDLLFAQRQKYAYSIRLSWLFDLLSLGCFDSWATAPPPVPRMGCCHVVGDGESRSKPRPYGILRDMARRKSEEASTLSSSSSSSLAAPTPAAGRPSRVRACLDRLLPEAVMIIQYNIPSAVCFTLRYGLTAVVLAMCGNQPAIVTMPDCSMSRLPLLMLSIAYYLANMLMFGSSLWWDGWGMESGNITSTSSSSSSSNIATSSNTAAAQKREVVVRHPPTFNVVWWLLMCHLACFFVRRVVRGWYGRV